MSWMVQRARQRPRGQVQSRSSTRHFLWAPQRFTRTAVATMRQQEVGIGSHCLSVLWQTFRPYAQHQLIMSEHVTMHFVLEQRVRHHTTRYRLVRWEVLGAGRWPRAESSQVLVAHMLASQSASGTQAQASWRLMIYVNTSRVMVLFQILSGSKIKTMPRKRLCDSGSWSLAAGFRVFNRINIGS